ncbi:MAG: AAA family ATPase [Bacteroidota bacterium]
MAKKIYVASTGQHRGKTTCTLGLVAALTAKGLKVGYCKPVGQKHLMVRGKMTDKDAVLFEQILQFKVNPELHSPVVIASGVTAEFIQNPEKFEFAKNIQDAADYLEQHHDVVVFEGTGHSGVGSIVNMSNAQVAKMLGAEVIIVIKGGIGSSFDRLNLNLALFREQNVTVKGVIVNKVHQDKMEHVRLHLGKKLEQIGIPLLGMLPFDRTLSFPLMGTVNKAIRGKVMFNGHRLHNQVEEILAGSLMEIDEFTYSRNMLLIVNQTHFHEAITKIKEFAKEKELPEAPLAGVIITGDGRQNHWYGEDDLLAPYLKKNEVPVLTTSLETYDTVVAISRIEVKINTKTPWKVMRAIELIKQNVNIDGLL